MTDPEQKELVRLLEVDYDKTTKLIEDIVGSSFTIRGWGIALISALIGLTFQAQQWKVAGLAVVVIFLIAFVDGYHTWLYSKILLHSRKIERVMGLYYASLARGEDDPRARREFEVAILAHRFGRFSEIQKFRIRDVHPRFVILTLYLTLLICAVASGTLVFFSNRNPATKFECTAVPAAANVYVCKPK